MRPDMVAVADHFLELLVQFLKLLTFFTAIVLPAVWFCLRRLSGLSRAARIGLGCALGFGLFVVGAWYIGTVSLDFLFFYWVAQWIVAGWLGRSSANPQPVVQHDVSSEPLRRRSWPVLFPLVAAIFLQLYALQFSILPHGVDSSFHCVVAQRQLDAGRATTDLAPLEELRLNYPIGSHLWLAVASDWTGLAVHEVFRHSFVIAICGAALVLAGWAERQFGTPFHGAATATAFLICTFQASLFPYTWGGLPSLIAMWLGMAALFCVVHLDGRAAFFMGTTLFASVSMSHHHTMVALLGGVGMVSVVVGLISRELYPTCVRMIKAVMASLLLAAIYVVPLAGRATDLGETSVLQYSEPFAWPWDHFWDWSVAEWPLFFTAVHAGVTLCTLALGLIWRVQGEPKGSRLILVTLLGVWLLSFCALDYGSRLIARWFGGPSAQPFTPSRFLFDAQFVLAVFAGGGLARVWDWLRRPAFRYALVSLTACGAILQVEPRWQRVPADALLPLGSWADRNLPGDALLTGSPNIWITYVFHRESTSLFIPISERAEPARQRMKAALLNYPSRLPWAGWRHTLGKPIYMIGYADDKFAQVPPLIVFGPYAIYDVNKN